MIAPLSMFDLSRWVYLVWHSSAPFHFLPIQSAIRLWYRLSPLPLCAPCVSFLLLLFLSSLYCFSSRKSTCVRRPGGIRKAITRIAASDPLWKHTLPRSLLSVAHRLYAACMYRSEGPPAISLRHRFSLFQHYRFRHSHKESPLNRSSSSQTGHKPTEGCRDSRDLVGNLLNSFPVCELSI